MATKKTTENKSEAVAAVAEKPKAKSGKVRLASGVLHVQSTYNNTKISVSDHAGNVVFWSSAGSLGFKGAKKGTPFAAAKVAELLADKAVEAGIREVDVVVRGVGSGRESSIRAFVSKGINLSSIKDATPVAHNGPRPKKPRRV